VTRAPIRDNTLIEDAQGALSNGAGPGLFCGRISLGGIRRALIAFDPAGALPAGALLDSVQLELHVQASSDGQPRTVGLHRVLTAWGEGASFSSGGSGAAAQPGDATWIHTFYPGSFWSSPGGDFVADASATTSVGEADGFSTWSSPALTADVAAWIADPASCHGWLLRGDESTTGTARRFDSRESPTAAWQPRLLLFFSSSTPTRPWSWGRLQMLYRNR
jgi:hypothetical protein